MSATSSGHVGNYVVVPPYTRDLIGAITQNVRVAQKYRPGESKGGFADSGIIMGSNTNLGTKWYYQKDDYRDRWIMIPLNNRDPLGARKLPEYKVHALFERDSHQPS